MPRISAATLFFALAHLETMTLETDGVDYLQKGDGERNDKLQNSIAALKQSTGRGIVSASKL